MSERHPYDWGRHSATGNSGMNSDADKDRNRAAGSDCGQ